MHRRRQIALSSFIKQQAKAEYKKIDLENKNINKIDELAPHISSEVQSLNLKNNRLSSLDNFGQFIHLKELDISGNRVTTAEEVLKLRGLANLSIICFSNNPFLDQPIDQQFLEFIIDKETDIDILSLDLVKQVEKQQIKIIFLKNYLNKIDLHSQLLKKEKTPQTVERLNTAKLMNKVIPQFYPSITSPKLTTTVKKEAFFLKRQDAQETFEEALARSKKEKERQIDQLIQSIVGIVHQSDTFLQSKSFVLEVDVNENTISFSPEKSNHMSPEKNYSPEKGIRKKFGSVKKLFIDQAIGSRIKERAKQKFRTPITKKEMPTADRKTDYIKVVDLEMEDRGVRRSPEARISPSLSTIKNSRSKVSDHSIYMFNQQLTPEKIQTIYFKTLSRVHPMFSLLYSPAASLSNEQKNIILEALKTNHRENFTELLKERWNNQNLMRQLQLLQIETENKLEQACAENRVLAQRQKDYEWIQKKYIALQDDYNELFHQLKNASKIQNNKQLAINSIQASYKKLKEGFIENKEKLDLFENCQEKQQRIAEKHEQFLQRKYLHQLIGKASLWKTVLDRERKAKRRHNKQLCEWGMDSFVAAGQFKHLKDKFIKKRQSNILRNKFAQWKDNLRLQRNQKIAIYRVKERWMSQFWQLLRKYEAESKLKKLRNIWAVRFEKESRYKNHFKIWKRLYLWRKQGQKAAIRSGNINIQKLFFKAWKQAIERRRQSVIDINDKHLFNKSEREGRRLLYLMKRQMIENRQKQHTVRVCHQHQLRKYSFEKFKKYAKHFQSYKQNKKLLRVFLFQKHMKVLKKLYKRKLMILNTFKKQIRLSYMGIVRKALNRQKRSMIFGASLLKKNKLKLIQNLMGILSIQKAFRTNREHLIDIRIGNLQSQKIRFIKQMQVKRLKGRNYVKRVAIEEMNFQMDLNDQNAIQIIKQDQHSIQKCETEIVFLKRQIQNQSAREMALLAEKDAMMITINESHEIMVQLGREVSLIRQQSFIQEQKYNELAKKYNQAVSLIQRGDKKYILLGQAQQRSPQ